MATIGLALPVVSRNGVMSDFFWRLIRQTSAPIDRWESHLPFFEGCAEILGGRCEVG